MVRVAASGKPAPESDPLFLRFWAAYPRKVAKPRAAAAWAKHAPDESLLAAMLAALAWQCRSERWTKDGGEFVPHPATWLNGRRWEDSPPGPPPPPPPPPGGRPAWKSLSDDYQGDYHPAVAARLRQTEEDGDGGGDAGRRPAA